VTGQAQQAIYPAVTGGSSAYKVLRSPRDLEVFLQLLTMLLKLRLQSADSSMSQLQTFPAAREVMMNFRTRQIIAEVERELFLSPTPSSRLIGLLATISVKSGT
jgi:hypothetical protein